MLNDPTIVQDICKRLRELNGERPSKYPWHKTHKELLNSRVREWDNSHPIQARRRRRLYDKTVRGRASKKARHARRRVFELNGVSFTMEQWLLLLEEFDNRCVYCGNKSKKLTVDHWVPLSKNGSNSIDNIVPACIPCNSSKCAKLPGEIKFKGRTQMVMASVFQRRQGSRG